MKNITYKELMARYIATENSLADLRKSDDSTRRNQYEFDIQSLGNPFIRDTSVILSSKANRRMGRKNQVASAQHFTHVRDRSTHVDEVIAHSIRLADHLGLNVHLAHSIAAGHDIGHVPFGHQGEHYIQERLGKPFTHEVIGVIIAQHVERKGLGLNLTWHTLDGMWRHSGNNASPLMTQEAWIVRYADKLAYLFADYNDFARFGWKCNPELVALMEWFGKNQRDRTFHTMMALCEESRQEGKVSFEKSEVAQKFNLVRKLMYQEYGRIVEQDVSRYLDPIWNFLDKTQCIPPWLGIALMTDIEVLRLHERSTLLNFRDIADTGMGEIINLIPREKLFSIDPSNLDLDWHNPYEIERKFLFVGDNFNHPTEYSEAIRITQNYLESDNPDIEVRVRKKESSLDSVPSSYWLTTKQDTGVEGVRKEVDKEISHSQYVHCLTQTKQGLRTIEKVRYIVPFENGLKFEIDVFEGTLSGLVLLECEFPNIVQMKEFVIPESIGTFTDVTSDSRYSNKNLSQYGCPI
jgi:dGTPase